MAGSLRAASFNRALLRAAEELAPSGVEITTFDGLDAL
ncbi:MAG: flavoprotein, partial [Candidatus Limnocylindria bacterium]